MTDPTPPKKRRALTHVGGFTATAGDRADADRLAFALAVPPSTDADDDPSRVHVHGFHTYPARMHPITAARLVAAFAPPNARVLDPFCGSGTVLVEALVGGRRGMGTDLNPLAVRLTRAKTRPRSPADLDRLAALAARCADEADDRRKGKAGATRRFPDEDVALYEPHVLLELDSLRAAVEAIPDADARADLSLVLSAVLVKLSRKKGDTASGVRARRTAAGAAARLFSAKAAEFGQRLAEFASLLPTPHPPAPAVAADDATVLRTVQDGGADAIVTSPPYAATYDYLEHHSLRLRWLGLDSTPLARGEIGSRHAYRRIGPRDAAAAWAAELGRFLTAAARVLRPGCPLVMMMADSAVGDVALRSDEIVADVARGCGFLPAARASQPRPHFHGPTAAAYRDRPRAEHAILLRRV